ncbi:hypothetical protein ANSO36C_20030 [Nostoc cf. commune SO-36]|uniref:HMA domain-containing protein n=1 Tax=Nostoc cf. commune SO-36 TaxID=449208 RepID=A0ABN6PYT7_NOSCO|nr:hypothetical protein ANSO36C_20030 [Nostoc cf. commune SO-36]
MALQLKVSNIACEGCAEIITEFIHVIEVEARVDIDVNAKIARVESAAFEESIKQVIVAAGYTVEGYCSGSSSSQKLKFNISGDANKLFYIYSARKKGGVELIYPH